MRVRTGVASHRVRAPKPAKAPTGAAKPDKAPKPVPRQLWDWHPLPHEAIAALRAAGHDVVPGGEWQVAVLRANPEVRLVYLRFRDGRIEGQAAGNSPFGRNAIFRASITGARADVDRALQSVAAAGRMDKLITVLGGVRKSYGRSMAQGVKAKKRLPTTTVLPDPSERSTSVRTVSGGLPSLGKRR